MADHVLFDVIFTGDIADGFSRDVVRQKVADLFKIDTNKAQALLDNKNVSLKKNLDEKTAKKYQQILDSIGLIVVIRSQKVQRPEPHSNNNAQKVAPHFNDQKNIGSESPASDLKKSAPDWKIDEVGVLLTHSTLDEKRPTIKAPSYTLAELPCNILRPEEMQSSPAAPVFPSVNTITINQVGESLLEDAERQIEEEVEVSIDHLSTHQVGGDLLSNDEKQKPILKNIDVTHLSVE